MEGGSQRAAALDGSYLALALLTQATESGHKAPRQRLEETLKPASLDRITAQQAAAIRKLAEEGTQLSLLDKVAEITSPDYPGERLMPCRDPLRADERARERRELLDATERKLLDIEARVRRGKDEMRSLPVKQ
jgi:hypothetical protein